MIIIKVAPRIGGADGNNKTEIVNVDDHKKESVKKMAITIELAEQKQNRKNHVKFKQMEENKNIPDSVILSDNENKGGNKDDKYRNKGNHKKKKSKLNDNDDNDNNDNMANQMDGFTITEDYEDLIIDEEDLNEVVVNDDGEIKSLLKKLSLNHADTNSTRL